MRVVAVVVKARICSPPVGPERERERKDVNDARRAKGDPLHVPGVQVRPHYSAKSAALARVYDGSVEPRGWH